MSGSRKRALVVTDHGNDEPPARRLRPLESIYQAHVRSELEDLKAALEHERSLRSLDQRRAQQIQTRLERQVTFAVEEAQEAKALLEDLREESDVHIAQLRAARAEALLQLRDCQAQLADAELDVAEAPNAEMVKKSNALLEEQLQSRTDEVEALRQRLMEVTEEKLSLVEPMGEMPAEPEYQSGAFVTAPTEVLRELNKTRIQLAESERKFRQLRRKSDEWHQKANHYVFEREANLSATARVHQVEQELRELRKEHEAVRASNQSWNDFAQELGALVMEELPPSAMRGPPEMATVLRHLEKAKLRTKQLGDDKTTLQKSLDARNERVAALETILTADAAALSKAITEKKEVESQLDSANQQLRNMRAQEGIYRREADSLRSLLKTFDELPGSRDAQTSATGATVKSLEVSLAAAREEIRALTEHRDLLTKVSESLSQQQKEQKNEYSRILEKFGRLREALHAEKGKVEEAESRACKAEALAGKGSYNPEESRVLHLAQNPLAEAIRDSFESQIRALHRQLEEVTGQKPARGAASHGSEVDPQKLHQRLKQSFKEQIALFREGVYLMTGYKVDMLPGEKPMFRVRSVYAEQEQDHLMFVCQKSGEEVTSLDLVETDLAKLLSTTDSYQYMTKFNSLPSFLASVQLSLFEKQTFIST
jgi:myosin heavy subunit